MKKAIKHLMVLSLLIQFSCNKDFNDIVPPFTIDPPLEITTDDDGNTILIDEEGNMYYSGGDCERGSPDYGVSGDVIMGLEIPEEMPVSYDLSEFLPPVRSQGAQGSCSAWAVTYYMKALQENLQDVDGEITILSPAYTYNQITMGDCTGTAVTDHLDILLNQGAPIWESFPYTAAECATQPSEDIIALAEENKISEFKGLSGDNMVNEIKALLLDDKPIIISTTLSNEFGAIDLFGVAAYRDHVVNYEETGCHAMLLVGYDDDLNAFNVVNSWGISWGNNGFVWIDYQAFENVVDEAANFRVINGAYVAYDLD